MAADLVLGIDCSTTASKAIAWSVSGEPIAEGRAPLVMLSPRRGWAEQDARHWWHATVEAIRAVVAQVSAARIAAICVTHQRETFVPVDRFDAPIRNGILWLDERSRAQLVALDRRFGHGALHRLTGRPPSMTQSLPKLIWLLENEPAVMRQAARFVDVHAYLVHALSGHWASSTACADPMGVVDIARGAWAQDLIHDIGLQLDQFVPLVAPGAAIASVSTGAATATGLLSGTPIIAGAGDGQAASLGAGVTGGAWAYMNIGTAIAGGAVIDRYVTDLAFRTCIGAIPGTYVLESVLRGGTSTVTWFMEHFADQDLGPEAFASYEHEAAALPPGSDGLMLVPYWNTVMNPYWDSAATGLVLGWTTAHRRHHLYRAILEGIAYEHRLAIEGIASAMGMNLTAHVLLGGGSRSPLWCQIVANVLDAPVARARSADATNLGAGILAAAAAGWFPSITAAAEAMTSIAEHYEPDRLPAETYDRLFRDVYVGLFPAVKPMMDRLTEITNPST